MEIHIIQALEDMPGGGQHQSGAVADRVASGGLVSVGGGDDATLLRGAAGSAGGRTACGAFLLAARDERATSHLTLNFHLETSLF